MDTYGHVIESADMSAASKFDSFLTALSVDKNLMS